MSEAPAESTEPAVEAVEEKKHEETVPYERFQKAALKAKEAGEKAKMLETQFAELKQQFEERESAGLPELERTQKDLERAQKRAEEAEAKAATAEQERIKTTKVSWVAAAANDFHDPAEAALFVNIDTIEDEKDAERVVRDLRKKRPHLLKQGDPQLPGQVLANGQAPAAQKAGGHDPLADAQTIAAGLSQFASRS